MAFVQIIYDEDDINSYEGIKVSSLNGYEFEEKIFDDGDFVKDWYYLVKFSIFDDNKNLFMFSSNYDHFLHDGGAKNFKVKYLDLDGDSPSLVEEEEYKDDIFEAWYFYLPEDMTWDELRKYCGDL